MTVSDERVYEGVCIFFLRNYGFIQWTKDNEPQTDLFVHWTGISGMEGFKTLKKDQRVSFKLGANNRGQLIAVDVRLI